MAVGTVSSSVVDNPWQLIATNTPTATTSSAFTSIAGYKKLMVVWKALTTGTAVELYLRVNSNSTAGNYASRSSTYGQGDIESNSLIALNGYSRAQNTGMIVIENANQSTPHQISDFANQTSYTFYGAILLAEPITRIDISNNGSNFSSGTIELWGVAA
jgi:hypothetical protein